MKRILFSLFIIIIVCKMNFNTVVQKQTNNTIIEKAEEVTPNPCDTSGSRMKNTTIDIGYDSNYANRQYYSTTNEYAQVIKVEAKDIILQNDNKESINSNGRYCSDEAKVKGTEKKEYDEGHIIADSLGGVSNSYNITPQNKNLNRKGEQYEIEEQIRKSEMKGKDVKNFSAEIKYKDKKTQIPTSYIIKYEVDGNQEVHKFKNGVN